ncbi:MAG: hypothetical protein ACE5O2_04180, partial [Armatimonadota bacterium]
HAQLDVGNATVLSRYASDGAPRDVVVGEGGNEVLYVNGLLGQWDDPDYFHALLREWAGQEPAYRIEGDHVIGTRLRAGNTAVVLAYNYDIREPREITCTLPIRGAIAEVRALSRDGAAWQSVGYDADYEARTVTIRDRIKYYGVYEVAFSDVRVESDDLAIQPGETRKFEMRLRNLSSRPVEGVLRVAPLLPSISSGSVEFSLAPRARKKIVLPVTAREDADWGRKTIVVEVETGARKPSYFWRRLVVQRPPDMRLATTIVDSAAPTVAVRNAEGPYVPSGPARNVRLRLGDVVVRYGNVWGGETAARPLPLKFEPAEKPSVLVRDAKITYEVGGEPREAPATVRVAVRPQRCRRMEGAIAPIFVFNPAREYLENAVVSVPLASLRLPKGFDLTNTHVREAGGAVIPSQLNPDERELLVVAMLPPQEATLLYLCDGRAPAPGTDLSVAAEGLETGHGAVVVSNSHFRLTLAEQAGGTATQFVVKASGTDYAAPNLFGLAYGSWGRFDPLKPRTNTVQYIGTETKVRQADEPTKITVLESGPLRATVLVEWTNDALKASQTYRFFAYQDYFVVSSDVQPRQMEGVDEVVVCDVRLRRNGLTKIFPNFTGIGAAFAQDKTQHGWREAPHVPDVAAFMIPERYEETISLIPLATKGIDRFRQGFWPEVRPKPGPAKWAEVEFVATEPRRAELTMCVLVRPGHQVVGQRFRGVLQTPPLATVPERPEWAEGVEVIPHAAAPAAGATWWNPYWHYRIPLVIARAKPGDAAIVRVRLDLDERLARPGARGRLDEASIRAVLTDEEFAPVAMLPSRLVPGGLELVLPASADQRARVHVYFDTVEHGPKKPPTHPVVALSTTLLDGSFEERDGRWELSEARVVREDAHTGEQCVALQLTEDMGTRVVLNRSMLIEPKREYRLTFWAKTETPGASVRTNLYSGARFDFPQIDVPLTADGRWHEYEVALVSGEFPPDVKPYLRLWIINKAQLVYIDDVSLAPMRQAPGAPRAEVAVGEVESPQ